MAAGNPTSEQIQNTYVVGASEYGGPHDPSTHGDMGSCGQHLSGKMAFAELYMGNALGHLPCGTQLYVSMHQGGHQGVIATKMDIGAGGAPVSGHARRIDLWYQTAQAIGFSGTGLVNIRRVDGKPIIGPSDTEHGTTTGAGVLGTGIGPNTEKEGDEASEKFKSAVESLPSWGAALAKALSFLFSQAGWITMLKVIGGAALLYLAIKELV